MENVLLWAKYMNVLNPIVKGCFPWLLNLAFCRALVLFQLTWKVLDLFHQSGILAPFRVLDLALQAHPLPALCSALWSLLSATPAYLPLLPHCSPRSFPSSSRPRYTVPLAVPGRWLASSLLRAFAPVVCCPLCWECLFSRSSHGWLLLSIQVLAQMLPSQKDLPRPPSPNDVSPPPTHLIFYHITYHYLKII